MRRKVRLFIQSQQRHGTSCNGIVQLGALSRGLSAFAGEKIPAPSPVFQIVCGMRLCAQDLCQCDTYIGRYIDALAVLLGSTVFQNHPRNSNNCYYYYYTKNTSEYFFGFRQLPLDVLSHVDSVYVLYATRVNILPRILAAHLTGC